MASEFFSGLSSDLGLVSLGTFFASKESTSATPKVFKARREGEISFIEKPASDTKPLQANTLAAKAKTMKKKPAAKAK